MPVVGARRRKPGRWLAENAGEIDLAVVSPAHRARTTWELASAELTRQPETRIDDRVYNASVSDLLDVVRDLPDEAPTVVLVGHNPGFEDLASLLTNEPVSMPTSALAVLESDTAWSSAGVAWASLRDPGGHRTDRLALAAVDEEEERWLDQDVTDPVAGEVGDGSRRAGFSPLDDARSAHRADDRRRLR